MVRPIIHDVLFLGRKSADADASDLQTAQDLLDTLRAHAEDCVGLAANMIGVSKRIIAFVDGMEHTVMLNPEIIRQSDPYKTEEGCLSLSGVRQTTRYRTIKVRYQNMQLQTRLKTYTGYTAQIIQHEVDHCSGVLI
ncbi:MAG: peptide deformylase [Ruminococcaceae bacterium]|nr:peptide deformylase [Oscillospiraceae bacterium]